MQTAVILCTVVLTPLQRQIKTVVVLISILLSGFLVPTVVYCVSFILFHWYSVPLLFYILLVLVICSLSLPSVW